MVRNLRIVIWTGLLAMLIFGWRSAGAALAQENPRDWEVYRNQKYGFELKQAPGLTLITPEGITPEGSPKPKPAPKLRLWFQRKAIATMKVALMEPAPLAVDIYDNPSRLSVEAWVDNNVVVDGAKLGREHVKLNSTEFLRLTGKFEGFPNVFYYIAHGPYVFRFTPSGLYGELMVSSLAFLQ